MWPAWAAPMVLAMAFGASSVAEAAPRLSKALKEQADFLCQRTEFGQGELRALRASADFQALVAYTLGTCPVVGAVLSDGATASVRKPPLPGENRHDREPGNGPRDKGGEADGESRI